MLGDRIGRKRTLAMTILLMAGATTLIGEKAVQRACAAADRTGHALLHTLYQRNVRARTHFFVEWMAIDLIRDAEGDIVGVVALEMETGECMILEAKTTIFATGGAGRIFAASTNAFINTGDGMGMAARAGQFGPRRHQCGAGSGTCRLERPSGQRAIGAIVRTEAGCRPCTGSAACRRRTRGTGRTRSGRATAATRRRQGPRAMGRCATCRRDGRAASGAAAASPPGAAASAGARR